MNGVRPVVDAFERPLRDLRISIIDRCNFRCRYCMPAEIFGPGYSFLNKDELLSFEEIVRLARIFVSLGVRKIRLTGGEPLLRKNVAGLVRELRAIRELDDLALTTNGILLADQAVDLAQAGLDRVNVSLDAMDDEVFGRINGRGSGTQPVLDAMDAAAAAGLKVKVNMVVKRGMNEDQIKPMARHFKDKGYALRFIEFMDVGNANGWRLDDVVSKAEILHQLNEVAPVEPVDPRYFGEVASRFRYQDGSAEVGVISSVTEPFCGSCTRARLSADGKVYTCLFASSGTDLRDFMREGATDADIQERIRAIWSVRQDRYSEERLAHTSNDQRKKIEMFYIGG